MLKKAKIKSKGIEESAKPMAANLKIPIVKKLKDARANESSKTSTKMKKDAMKSIENGKPKKLKESNSNNSTAPKPTKKKRSHEPSIDTNSPKKKKKPEVPKKDKPVKKPANKEGKITQEGKQKNLKSKPRHCMKLTSSKRMKEEPALGSSKSDTEISLKVGTVNKPLIDFGTGDERVADPIEEKLETLEEEGKKLPDAEKEEDDEDTAEPESDMKKRYTEEEMVTILQKDPSKGWLWGLLIKNNADTKGLEAARARCTQALELLPFRFEDEKLWVWSGMLEAELVYGDKNSLATALRKARTMLDETKVMKRMAIVYAENNKFADAELCFQTILSKNRNDSKTWAEFVTFLFRNGLCEQGRTTMSRGLKSLPKARHMQFIAKNAQLEMQYGDIQRGVKLFESLVTNFPKKTEIWTVYVDKTIKAGLIQEARCLLQRAIAQELKPYKTKLFLIKFTEFERKHGTETDISAVQDLQKKYCISVD